MEEGRPDDSRQGPKLPRDDTVLVELAAPKQIVDDEHHPAKSNERNDWREALEHRYVASIRRLVWLPSVHECESTEVVGF